MGYSSVFVEGLRKDTLIIRASTHNSRPVTEGDNRHDVYTMFFAKQRQFSFTCGLRPLNNDVDVLQFAKDVTRYELVDLYVEHTIDDLEVLDESELGHGDGGPNANDNDDVQCTSLRSCNINIGDVQEELMEVII
ncbi:hypothetical protein KIW84_045661 [Lathyrus oleraceus]|uniref:Uncharacterized protein n=1 Tax=Pisum sativum TaxID=3888 RepID=A0A9D4XKR6_PEA|nr:hypothetical protein KIW84_045661 [Pisum sativum]